jgi:hypothetical protein
MFLNNIAKLEPTPTVIVAGGSEDPCHAIAKEFQNVVYFPHEQNLPLGQKNNAACKFAARFESDYLMYVGDDNFMSQTTWDYYNQFQGDFLGLSDLYFYDGDKMYYFMGYTRPRNASKGIDRTGEPLGPFKLIKTDLLKQVGFEPWDNTTTRATDWSFWQTIKRIVPSPTVVRMSETGGVALDYKTEVGLTKLSTIPNTYLVEAKPILEQMWL